MLYVEEAAVVLGGCSWSVIAPADRKTSIGRCVGGLDVTLNGHLEARLMAACLVSRAEFRYSVKEETMRSTSVVVGKNNTSYACRNGGKQHVVRLS